MTDFISTSPLPCLVNNQPYKTAKTYPVYRTDVSDRQVLHEVHCASVDDVKTIVDSAAAAFPKWKATPIAARRDIFLKAAALLAERLPEYLAKTVEETCIPKGMSGFELAVLAQDHLKEAAALMSSALQHTVLPDGGDGATKYILREPMGVVLGITPWNAPIVLALRSVLWALAAGNSAVMKTSEFSPRCGLMVGQVLVDAGLPAGALSIVHVDPSDAPAVTEAIIAHKAVRLINFTGSTRVGRIIAQTAAKHLKPCLLELGGKAPLLVLDDADLDLVANHVLFGGFLNTNQICMSVNNVIVPRDKADELQQKVAKLMADNAEVFTAKREQNLQSPHALRALFTAASGDRLKGLYDDAISQGAHVVAGKAGFDGALVQPVILGGVEPKMRIFHEETFGPVLSLITYEGGVDAGVELANNNAMGLAAAVYGRDTGRAYEVASRIEAGQVHVNAHSVHDSASMPHGGFKESGYGRVSGGIIGIQAYTQTKGITVQKGTQLPFSLM